MSKIYFSLFIFVCSLSFVSCMSDDDDDDIDYEWKDYQTKVYNDISVLTDDTTKERIYTPLKSESGNGSVYWKTSDFITNRMNADFSQKYPDVGYPATKASAVKPSALTDSVVVRYEGWYYDKNGKFTIFDPGTEVISGNKPPYTGTNNNTSGTQLAVSGVVDGFRTIVMDMTVNDERIVCIPYNMGYGSRAQSSIPAYTTLFFDIKLLKIISGDGTVIADGTTTVAE